MGLTDDNKTYKFYNNYARNIGLSVMKNQGRTQKFLLYIEASLAIERVMTENPASTAKISATI